LNNATTEQQLKKEIELVKNANYLYDKHAQKIKLEQLENKLLDERLNKKEEERKKTLSLVKKYEEGDASEKARIIRVTELAKMAPEALARQYEGDLYDKGVITDYWDTFSQEGQRAIEDIIIKLSDLPSLKSDYDLQMEGLDRLSQLSAKVNEGKIIPNITNVGAQEVNVNVDLGGMPTSEEMIKLISDSTIRELLSNEEFQKAFSRKMINVLPGGK
jgi:hypothetical protein